MVRRLFYLYLSEDCPYNDITTETLNIQGKGSLKIETRESGISACSEELAEFLNSEGISVEKYTKSGAEFEKGDTIFSATGGLQELFRIWRVAQTFLSITSGIATKTKILIETVKTHNNSIIVATTRKTHRDSDILSSVRSEQGVVSFTGTH